MHQLILICCCVIPWFDPSGHGPGISHSLTCASGWISIMGCSCLGCNLIWRFDWGRNCSQAYTYIIQPSLPTPTPPPPAVDNMPLLVPWHLVLSIGQFMTLWLAFFRLSESPKLEAEVALWLGLRRPPHPLGCTFPHRSESRKRFHTGRAATPASTC